MEDKFSSTPIIGLISSEFISLIGNQVALVAIPILVLQLTNSPLTAGIAGIGNILPVILSAIIGGQLIDRFNAYRVSIISDTLSGISVIALPLVLFYYPSVSPLFILLLVFIGAAFDPTGISARQTLVPRLTKLSGKSLDKVNSYRGTLENAADYIGPILGAWLIALIGINGTLALNGISFFIAATIVFILVPQSKNVNISTSPISAFGGIRFVISNHQLRALAFMGMFGNFVLLPFLGLLLPVLAVMHYKNTMLLGASLSAFGLAATIGAFFYSWLSNKLSRSSIFYGGLAITSISIILCSFLQSQTVMVICVALAGLFLGASNPLEQTVLHEVAPQNISGQVFTSHSAIRFLAGPIGLLLAGIMIEQFNVLLVIKTSGVFLFIASIIGRIFLPITRPNM